MLVPNRHGSSNAYRYGFQGQEKDDELKGEGNSLNYTFRMHDPRVGRFFAVDPLTGKYPWYSPYSFSGNKPIQFAELEGLEEKTVTLFIDTGGDGEQFVAKTHVHIQKDITYEISGKHYAKTIVAFVIDGHFSSTTYAFYEEVGDGAPVPSAAYNYTQSSIDGKFTDDWKYILKGNPKDKSKYGWSAFTRGAAISIRDDRAPDNIENLQDLNDLLLIFGALSLPLERNATTITTVRNTKPPKLSTNDLVKSSKLVSPKTTGPEITYNRTGDYTKAVEEFNSLEGISNIKPIIGSKFEGYTGKLPDGSTAVVRSGSSANAKNTKSKPTLEIQPADKKNGQTQKFRYE